MVRLKSRYFLCEICVSDGNSLQFIEEKAVYFTIKAAVSKAHGDYGAATSNLGMSVKYVNAHTGVVLIRSRKAHYRLLWSALPFITSLENRGQRVSCVFNCLHIGGTIRTCQKFLIKYNREQLHRMLLDCKNNEAKQDVRRAIQSCSIANVRGEEMADEEDEDEN